MIAGRRVNPGDRQDHRPPRPFHGCDGVTQFATPIDEFATMMPWAAAGSIVPQVLAMGFHASRGKFAVMPLNLVLFALAAFVRWGSTRAVPFAAAR